MLQTHALDRRHRLAWSWSAAFACHFALFLVLAGIVARSPRPSISESAGRLHDLVWLARDGEGGGGPRGGGGGDQRPEPQRPLQHAGSDRASVPAAPPPPDPSIRNRDEPDPLDHITIAVQPLGDALASMPGKVDAPPAESDARGPGRGLGFGNKTGDGDGLGGGSGLGDDHGRNIGDGPFHPGSGVTMPIVVHVEKPRYSADAMRARIQGLVTVECIVRLNGACSDIRVVRSLDPRFGLDEEARRAAALWRFRPGTRFGQLVSVVVRIELEFSVR